MESIKVTTHNNLLELVQTGENKNIELAFELAKRQDINLNHLLEKRYNSLVGILQIEEENLTKKLVQLFNLTTLNVSDYNSLL